MWNTVYTARGILEKGFVGQISYTVCLDKEYSELDIAFSFDPEKQYYSDISEELVEEIKQECEGCYDSLSVTEEEVKNAIRGMKTEIQTIALMNDIFIGGIHKQLASRNMTFTSNFATEGCIPQAAIYGVLRVTIVVFNVILPDTEYSLTVLVR